MSDCVVKSQMTTQRAVDYYVELINNHTESEAGTYRDEDLSGIPALWVADSFSKFNWGFESVCRVW